MKKPKEKIPVREIRMSQVMLPHFAPMWSDTHRFLVLVGGRGAGKSYWTAQKVLFRVMTEKPHTIICIRKIARTLRESVFKLLVGIIDNWGVRSEWDVNQTQMKLVYKPNHNEIICLGLDDAAKIKSITGAEGAGVTGMWVEEATDISQDDLIEIDMCLRGTTPLYQQMILTFNPINEFHWLKSFFFDRKEPNSRVDVSTYRDNIFLVRDNPGYIERIERLSEIDHQLYRIFGLGQWGILTGLIFRMWPTGDLAGLADETIYGLDFGYSSEHPTALIRIDIKDRAYYLSEVVYESGLTTPDLIGRMELAAISQSDIVYADAAEPDRIDELRRAGYLVEPADKSRGSVRAGILFMKAANIFTKLSNINLAKEVSTYKWREDNKTGKIMLPEQPVKINDDLIDSARYAMFTHAKRDRGVFENFRARVGIGAVD